MKHQGTRTLETPRLILRRFCVGDAPAMFRNWSADPEVTRFMTWMPNGDIETARAVLRSWVPEYRKADYYQWAIVLKSLGEPVGSISVVHSRDDIRSAEIGYCIGRRWWHQGITSEAFGAVIVFLIGGEGYSRIEARHDPRNPHSGGVMKKCGLRYEGTMRQADKNNQGICDYCMYGLLAEDYRKLHPDR